MSTTIRRIAYLLIIFAPLYVIGFAGAMTQDAEAILINTLERANVHWQEGRPVEAYVSLDSINNLAGTPENAGVKIKAALQTARYLQAQRKFAVSARFLDSALVWSEQFQRSRELLATYEAYGDWQMTVNNARGAVAFMDAAAKLRDSLLQSDHQHQLDSLRQIMNVLADSISMLNRDSQQKAAGDSGEVTRLTYWVYGLSSACIILLVILFLINGQLQRIRRLPPAPVVYAPIPAPTQPTAPVPVPPRVPVSSPVTAGEDLPEDAGVATPSPIAATDKIPAVPAVSEPAAARIIAAKLNEVELVLINPEVLALYNNSDLKAIRQLLQEYISRHSVLLKELDEAIGKNEADPIIRLLNNMRYFLEIFGMDVSIKLVNEIEEDAPKEKVAKLLSRVFQVRNHCRRAADEAKALLDKLN